jgi:hypothetical protein
MERWIPDFKASALGVQGSVNWLQINHSLVSNRDADWKDDTIGKSLVYNTQTGKTRAVNPADRVVSTPSERACYVMQHLNIAGQRVLAFYDSGANSNIVEYDLARDAGFHQIGFEAVSFKVAGGGSVRSSCGQFSAILGPDVNGNTHDVECQAVDQITGTFPTFRLDDIITEARATIGAHHVFPQEIGGAPVKLLIGIRSTQLAPVLKFTLPSGLCVYESKFCDVYGATLCFGGPHEVFTRGYKHTGSRVTTGMLQVLFAESASAYMGGIRAVVGASIEEEEAADSLPNAPPAVAMAQSGPAGDTVTKGAADGPPSAPPAVASVQPEPASDAAGQGVAFQPDSPASCDPLTVCTDQDVIPPPENDGGPPVDVHRSLEPATGEPLELTAGAKRLDLLPSTPEPNTLLMVAATAPDRLPIPPELSTGMDDQRISPVEGLAQGFTAVTLVLVTDKSPDPQMEQLRTPRASDDEDLASRCDVCTKRSTLCGYEDVPSSPPVKEVPGIRPDRAPDELSSPGAVPKEVPHARPSRAPDFPPDRGAPDCGSASPVDQLLPKKVIQKSRK